MFNINDHVAYYMEQGYQEQSANARVSQDIVLKAISLSRFSENVTIKGGVVMRSITKNIRRATDDIDLDFIRYSLSDESIKAFIRNLDNIDGISIKVIGGIEELSQQEYSGKRIYILIRDNNGYTIKSKIDLGVHKNFDLCYLAIIQIQNNCCRVSIHTYFQTAK